MNEENFYKSVWFPEDKLLTTKLTGIVNIDQIKNWERTWKEEMNKIKAGEFFKIYLNLYGFEALDIEAHKKFRTIIPLTLADYGWRAGYIGLYKEEEKGMKYSNIRGISCVAAAHCHHDSNKMKQYQKMFGKDNEKFFDDVECAEKWISDLPI